MDWGINMNKLVSWFKLLYWKIMTVLDGYTENWETSEGEISDSIDESQIFTIIFAGSEIIVIYTNGANDRFPATTKNIDTAYRVLSRLRKKITDKNSL